jgi:hypothetical protein
MLGRFSGQWLDLDFLWQIITNNFKNTIIWSVLVVSLLTIYDSQGCQIESKSNRIQLSNRMLWLKLNQIVCRSNWMFFFFDFWYDLIWRRFWNQKIKNNDSKKWKFCRKWSQMILPVVSDILVYPPFEDWPTSWLQEFFLHCSKVFYWIESISDQNRINSWIKLDQYWIKIKLNRKVAAPFESKIESNQKQFDLTALMTRRKSASSWYCRTVLYSRYRLFLLHICF